MKKPWAYIVIQIFAQKPTSEDKKKEYKKEKTPLFSVNRVSFFLQKTVKMKEKMIQHPFSEHTPINGLSRPTCSFKHICKTRIRECINSGT